MFMFRRRSWQVKRLLNECLPGGDETGRQDQIKKLVKKLTDRGVEVLLGAVLGRGGGGCVPADPVDLPQVVACRAWRWPDLQRLDQIKRMPACRTQPEEGVCCNPYHWSKLCQPTPDIPPPPYCRYASERLKPEDRAPSEESQLELRGSLSTNGEGDPGDQWCRLAYWELSNRIGRQFSVATPSVNVFWNLPQGDGLCLSSLARQARPPDPVRKAREKIGRGLTLSKEKDGVWAYNCSDVPLFVNSPCLEEEGRLVVYRVPAGHCLNIYSRPPRILRRPPQHVGPVDSNSIRISFVKGWGSKYSRQDVTACPTWLEVLLAPCR